MTARTLATGLLLTTTVALGACGGSSSKTSTPPPPPAATPQSAVVDLSDAIVSTGAGKSGTTRAADPSILKKLPEVKQGAGVSVGACASASAIASAANLRPTAGAILCLLNQQRTAHGLRPLRLNKKLAKAALRHSKVMVARHFFAHEGVDGNPLSRIRKVHYIPRRGRWTVGENLAAGTGTAASAQQIVVAWMNSPPHKANILTRAFREIGIGIVPKSPTSPGPGATYTTEFGAKNF